MRELNSLDGKSCEGGGRRRFVRSFGVAIPATLTISARSALAATCTTQSAAASIALNNSHNSITDVNQPCNGLSPAEWANLSANDYGDANVDFSSIFASGPNLNMRTLLRTSNGGVTNFMKYLAAAYVNSINGRVATIFYTVQNLQDMWTQGPLNNYQPVPGANWGQQQIMDYLADTWT